MKRLRGIIIAALAVLGFASGATAQLATYNLSADYSTNQNPKGVWSYGFLTNLTAPFSIMGNQQQAVYPNGATEFRWNRASDSYPSVVGFYFQTGVSDGGQGNFPPGTILAFGGFGGTSADYSAIRFTAPSNGTYSISIGATNYLNGGTASDTDFHIRSNGVAIISRFFPAIIATNIALTMDLAAGATLDIAVGRGADNSLPGSGLKLGAIINLMGSSGAGSTLSTSFSLSTNSNAGWTLGWKGATNGAFTPYTARFSGSAGAGNWEYWGRVANSEGFVRKNVGPGEFTIGGQGTFPVGSINAVAGPNGAPDNYAVARYTVPASGTYRVSVWGTASGSGNIDVHVASNSIEDFGRSVAAGGTAAFTNTASYTAGTVIDVAVGRGADNDNFGSVYLFDARVEPISPVVPSLASSFSLTTNSNAGWTLGWKGATNGAFTPYTARFSGTFGAGNWEYWGRAANSEGYIRKNVGPIEFTVGGQGTFPVGSINAVSGPSGSPDNYSVARYTIPTNGTYRVSVWGTSSGSGDIDVHVASNSVEDFGKSVPAGGTAAFTNTVSYLAGTVIDIAVGRGTDNNNTGSVYLFDAIVEPVGVGAPTPDIGFAPAAGPFTNQLTVALVNNVGAGQIRLTVNGVDPVASSSLYTNSFVITSNATIRAGLFLNGFPISGVYTAAYTKVIIDDIQFVPAPGVFTNQLTVRMTNIVGSGQMRFTINGADPTGTSPLYTGSFTITSNATIRAGLFLNGFPISLVYTGAYGRVYALDDGVPNSWRLQYFGAGYLTDPRVGAGTDADGDGSSNLQEYLAGTDPLNPLSGFTIGIQAIPRISFVSVPGTTYKILRRDNANSPTGVEVGQVTASGTQTTFIDTSVTNPTGFYTVQPLP